MGGTHTCTEGRPHEDTEKRKPSTSHGERPQEKSSLHIPWPWSSSLQNWKKRKLLFKPPNLWYFVRAALANLLLWMWESSHFLEFDREMHFLCTYLPIWECLLTWLYLGPELTLAGLTSCHHGGEPGPDYSTQVLTFIPHSCVFSSIQCFMDFCCHWSWWLLCQRTSSPVLGEWLS